jgi:hypothetical protein
MPSTGPISRLTTVEGNKSLWQEIISYPIRYIKYHENKISYSKFLDIVDPLDPKK